VKAAKWKNHRLLTPADTVLVRHMPTCYAEAGPARTPGLAGNQQQKEKPRMYPSRLPLWNSMV